MRGQSGLAPVCVKAQVSLNLSWEIRAVIQLSLAPKHCFFIWHYENKWWVGRNYKGHRDPPCSVLQVKRWRPQWWSTFVSIHKGIERGSEPRHPQLSFSKSQHASSSQHTEAGICVKCKSLCGHHCIFRHSQEGKAAAMWIFSFSQTTPEARMSEDCFLRLSPLRWT